MASTTDEENSLPHITNLKRIYSPTLRIVRFGVSRMRENGIASVGCSQFLSSYTAWGGDSIM
jgi:hypothetical protein